MSARSSPTSDCDEFMNPVVRPISFTAGLNSPRSDLAQSLPKMQAATIHLLPLEAHALAHVPTLLCTLQRVMAEQLCECESHCQDAEDPHLVLRTKGKADADDAAVGTSVGRYQDLVEAKANLLCLLRGPNCATNQVWNDQLLSLPVFVCEFGCGRSPSTFDFIVTILERLTIDGRQPALGAENDRRVRVLIHRCEDSRLVGAWRGVTSPVCTIHVLRPLCASAQLLAEFARSELVAGVDEAKRLASR